MRLRHRIALLALAPAAALAVTASAQTPPTTPEFQVNAFTTNDQFGYSALLDHDGSFVVTWDSDGEDGASWSAVARRFDANQAPLTGDIAVNTFTTGIQDWTRGAMDGSGRFVVVWSSDSHDGSDYGVFARRFDRDGTPLSAEIPVNTYTTNFQGDAFVATDPSGNFVVVWTSYTQDGQGDGVAARRFDRTGAALGNDFVVNTFTSGNQYADGVTMDGAGNFVVVWTQNGGGSYGIFARRYDAAGTPQGGQFQVDTTSDYNGFSDLKADRAGNFVVVWHGAPTGTGQRDILARRFDATGAPLGDEFVVNQSTTGDQLYPTIAMDNAGNYLVTWSGVDADASGVFGRRYDRFGNPVSDEFPLNQTTASNQYNNGVGANSAGDFVADWSTDAQDGAGYGVFATRAGLAAYEGAQVDVDPPAAIPSVSDLNGVLEPGETVVVEPTWSNRTAGGIAVTGTATDFSGPAGATYTLNVPNADYGSIPTAGSANCFDATALCYVLTVSDPGAGARPAQHWDAALQEKLDAGTPKTWALHVGNSFPDMPHNLFYPFVENLFHNGITGGCAGGGYCPGNDVTRAQMAVFLLKSKYSADYVPPPATGTVFLDVPASNPFAPWIENLAALGITGGCGSGNYCPTASVTRAQMAVFLLKTKNGSSYTPPTGTGIFGDVTCPGAFCDFIEDLYNQQITGGCSTSPLEYCPNNPNLRQQMAVFLVKTFGLKLYGP
jgi:hypothetical protein